MRVNSKGRPVDLPRLCSQRVGRHGCSAWLALCWVEPRGVRTVRRARPGGQESIIGRLRSWHRFSRRPHPRDLCGRTLVFAICRTCLSLFCDGQSSTFVWSHIGFHNLRYSFVAVSAGNFLTTNHRHLCECVVVLPLAPHLSTFVDVVFT